ncbi:adhesion G-protein coupled receptor G7-like [Clavelina lepadiformis]|uniref:adhesion G-protein coupled receptor G7-like n=1 Tax=Clavelina lepadiformis TaxID=159417 RepID=UPI0040413C95
MKMMLRLLLLILLFIPSILAQVDCGFESTTEPFCNYENVGWEQSSRGTPKEGSYFLAKYSYIPEATLTLKTNTSEDLELSFSFWHRTDELRFRVVQVSGSTEEEVWIAENRMTTGYLDVGGIKVKKDVKIKFIAAGNALVYLDDIKSVATTPIPNTSATTSMSTTSTTTPISTTSATTSATTPISTTSATTSATTPISTTSATTPISTTSTNTPISTTSTNTPIPTASATTLISTTSATTPISTTSATTPIPTASATTLISTTSATTPISTISATTPISTASATTPISTSSASTLSSTFSATTPTSTTSNILSPAQIETKIKDLESIVSSGTSLTKQTFTEVVNTVGNLTFSRKHFNKNTAQRLLRILDQVADKVNVSDREVFNATTPNVFVAVVNLPEANSTNGGDVYGVELSVVNHLTTGFNNESFSLHYEEKDTNQSNIFIPYEVINKSKDGKVSFYSFLGDSLFKSNASTNAIEEDAGYEESFVNSHVVLSATILDPEVSTENLTEKIKLSFRINENTSIFGSSFCGFWVEDGSYWSAEGCTKLSSSEQLLRCECNHLTNFASLFAYGNLTHDKGLDVLTYVGCSISAIASLLMIIALLIIWKSTKVQMRQSTKFVMLNLSFSLFLLNILILISEIPGVRSDEGKCKAAAGSLHFALISAFVWMLAQAVPVFISIFKPIYFRVYFSSKNFVISFLLLGWGLPLILVVLIGSLKPEWYVNQVNDVNPDETPKIQGQFRCWIVPDMMIYLVIIPAAVLLSGNVLLYVFSTAKYLLQKRPGEKPIKRREGQLKTNLKFSVTLFVMFGITWIFGFLIFNSSDVSLAFAYIFTIFNSLQGFALFIIFFQRKGMKENIRESLFKLTPRPSVVSNSRVTEERTSVSVPNTTRT